jgi:predicted transcriptional regulator
MAMKTRFAEAIYSGHKKYEFRRNSVRISPGSTVLIYEVCPVGLITGQFLVADVIMGTPSEICDLDETAWGRDVAKRYLAGAKRCSAIRISLPEKWGRPLVAPAPIPQSYRFLD